MNFILGKNTYIKCKIKLFFNIMFRIYDGDTEIILKLVKISIKTNLKRTERDFKMNFRNKNALSIL